MVLFSPVGGTDPIAENNLHDGSLLHICRVYHPDKVYLYLSGEMMMYHEKDNRYCYCLDRLKEAEGFQMEYEIIDRRDLIDVSQYDYFYRDFYRILSKIQEEMKEKDKLLLNIASGSPQMKSALLVMQQMTEGRARCIQVKTPGGARNVHKEIEEYDVETLWELDTDNVKNYKNRCEEVVLPSLVSLKKLEIIKEQISNYDYNAALSISYTLPEKSYGKLKNILNLARARQDLDTDKIKKSYFDLYKQMIPIKGNGEDVFEYALKLGNKLEKREYVDFLRGITPILVDMFEMVLRDYCGLDIRTLTIRDNHGSLKWDSQSLEGTETKLILDNWYRPRFKAEDKYVQSDHLTVLIENKCRNRDLRMLVRNLRNVESSIRNMAAHEIVSVTDNMIHDRTGLYGREVMDMIRQLFNYSSLASDNLDWDSYKKMNEMIKELISEEMKLDK